MKGAFHEGVQDIGWGRMSRTYCVSVRDRSEDLLNIKHTYGFKLNGVGALQTRACRGNGGVDPLEFRHADPVKFGVLVVGLGPNYEKGCRPTLHKLVGSWSRSPDEPKAGRNQSV